MQYVYVLQSKKDGDLYIGCTKNLKNRLKLHNAKKVPSTRHRVPFILIYYEAYINAADAYNREKYLKSGWGRTHIHKALRNFFISLKIR